MRRDFNLYQCNPSTLKSTHTTCLPDEMLESLRAAWNERFPDHTIPASVDTKDALWRALRERMNKQYECASEYCAVQQLGSATDKQKASRYFRPTQPSEWKKDPREWHDTLSIAQVLQQYEDAFPFFEFIGPTPIDFDAQLPGGWGKCVMDELCKIDLQAMKKNGTKYIGIVFNLDPHDRPGSHWVCAFIDLMISAAYYYDSYGYDPPAEVRRLLRRCRDQGVEHIFWNDIRHQRKKSECGTYCMYVIVSLLQGRTFADICKNRVPDDTMNAFRDLFYATEKPRPEALERAIKLLKL
jgi:hypothetical protein